MHACTFQSEPVSHPHPSASQHIVKTSAFFTLLCEDQRVKETITVPERKHIESEYVHIQTGIM